MGMLVVPPASLGGTIEIYFGLGSQVTGLNLGGGSGVFKQKVVDTLEFRTLTAGPNITLTQSATEIQIQAASFSGITGTLTAQKIPYATGASTVADGPFWDNVNNKLGIGAAPGVNRYLDISISSASAVAARVLNTGTGEAHFELNRSGGTVSGWSLYLPSGSTELRINNGSDRLSVASTGVTVHNNLVLPTISQNDALTQILVRDNITNNIHWRNVTTVGNISGTLTAPRVPFASAPNTLTDQSNFYFDGSELIAPGFSTTAIHITGTNYIQSSLTNALLNIYGAPGIAGGASNNNGGGLYLFGGHAYLSAGNGNGGPISIIGGNAFGTGAGGGIMITGGNAAGTAGSITLTAGVDTGVGGQDGNITLIAGSADASGGGNITLASSGILYLGDPVSGVYPTLSTSGIIYGSTYTPTALNNNNVTGFTTYVCQFFRIGNIVHVSGKITPTLNVVGTDSEFFLTLPIASGLTTQQQLAGVGSYQFLNGSFVLENRSVSIFADTTGDRAFFDIGGAPVGASVDIYFTFTYQLL